MTPQDIEAQAKALYERNTNGSAPRWEMLGEVTKGVWREEVQAAAGVPVAPDPLDAAAQKLAADMGAGGLRGLPHPAHGVQEVPRG